MTSTTNSRIRFMDNNLAELTTGQIQYSSELTAFPGANSTNKFRSKVWGTQGHFLIEEDVNDKLYIDDGAQKTITITAGDYTSPASLATEVQSQLNAASSGWTFDYNATAGNFKFRFAHASAHTLEFATQTEAAWSTLGFTLTTDEVISTDRVADRQRNHTKEYVIFDLGYNATIEFIAAIGPLDEEFSLSSEAVIKLQANNLDQWDAPPLDVTLTRTDGGLFRFLDDIADTNYRFWRIEWDDKLNPAGPESFKLSYIYLGDYTTLTNRNIQTGFNKRIVDPSVTSTSESGALFFDRKTKYSEFRGGSIALINKDQRDTLEQLFFDFGKTTPLFISIDPTTCISNELFDLTKYVVFSEEPVFTHVNSDLFNMSLQFREVL